MIDEIAGRKKKRTISNDLIDLRRVATTNPEGFELVKVRLINTRKFLITLRFTANKFVVIGDLRPEKELKIIEIDKAEAL